MRTKQNHNKKQINMKETKTIQRGREEVIKYEIYEGRSDWLR